MGEQFETIGLAGVLLWKVLEKSVNKNVLMKYDKYVWQQQQLKPENFRFKRC